MLLAIAPAALHAFIVNTNYTHVDVHYARSPLSEKPAVPFHQHDHPMLDFEVVDDAPSQVQQSKTEYTVLNCVFSNAMFPVVQHDRYFSTPVSKIPGPPPKNR